MKKRLHPIPMRAGLSLVELLISLAITAMLLTATMVATDACFRAYADAATQFSTEAATRMVTTRLMQMLRTSTAQGPLDSDLSVTPNAVRVNKTITSPYVELIDSTNHLIRVEWKQDTKELWMTRSAIDGSGKVTEPLISGVTSAVFTCVRRKTNANLWVLDRASMDLTIEAAADGTLQTERGVTSVMRVVGSTMPRKLQDE